MITKELLEYVKEKKTSKLSDNEIRENLENIGWKKTDIIFALSFDYDGKIPVPPYEQELKNVEKGYRDIWDAFLHITMFFSMYVSAIAFGTILFKFVDVYFPTPTWSIYTDPLNGIESALSSLLVTFPFFAVLFLKISKDTKTNPKIRGLKARKILIYMTLIAAFITSIISLIAVLTQILEGSLRTNYLLKALIIIVMSVCVFAYYLKQVQIDRKQNE